jgi:4-methyl-5(b-hydroxyethyl)-thiazole monophosphate biosynthesis
MQEKHVIVPLAEGFEEIEAVAVIDILRRAGVHVTVAGVGETSVTGSHGIRVGCDARIEDCDAAGADAIVLPGGMPGTVNLGQNPHVTAALTRLAADGKLVAAICAAPTVLNNEGLLEGRRATSHPAHADDMNRCCYLENSVVVDGNLVTSRGAGTAIPFAAEIVARLVGAETAREILESIQTPVS